VRRRSNRASRKRTIALRRHIAAQGRLHWPRKSSRSFRG
jgi:hypothetical protein